MAKPELGTKRLCTNCGAKFYDLSKDPIVCPKCHTVLELAAVSARSRPEPAAAVAARAAPAPQEEVVAPETQEAEFVSLEEADAEVESVTSIWAAADWLEREVWDMFGIRFRGHPNLKRILMYEEFVGHPLRKDYPLNKRQPLVGPIN